MLARPGLPLPAPAPAAARWSRGALRVAGYLLLWTAIAALFALQSIVAYSYSGTLSMSGPRLLAFSLADWFPWAVLTPAIVWLARRVGFAGHPWRALAVHVVACLLFVIARSVMRLALGSAIPSVRIGLPGLMASMALHVVVYWAIVVAALALEYSRMYRGEQLAGARLKTQLARAELGLLKMQLQPHFLFNTLNAISEQVHADPESAERMITQLSELLRHTIRSGNAHEISLREELALLERYLGIQRARFGGRLSATIDVEEDGGVMEALVPNLVLQPLVENAIQHGIAPRASGGRIEIAAQRDASGERLLLEVRDDGVGLAAAEARRREGGSFHEGVGIANTMARLRQLYGDAFEFVLRDRSEGGVVAGVSLPLHAAAVDGAGVPTVAPRSQAAELSSHGA